MSPALDQELDPQQFLEQLPRAHGAPVIRAVFKQQPEDFQVDEELGWSPSGQGEHLCLHVRKRGISTLEVARRLAEAADLPRRSVSYAGLKDRQSVSRQWFSLHLPGREDPDFSGLEGGGELWIESAQRNHRKLRRGTHKANHFRIRLREVEGAEDALATRIENIRQHGVPNYFGAQRFGHDAVNVRAALRWFAGDYRPRSRNERSLLLSAARSFLFNAVLARRVTGGSWNRALPGERLMLEGSNSRFSAEPDDPQLAQRLAAGDVHPGGVLWGRGEPDSSGEVRSLELATVEQWPLLARGLEEKGLEQARRSLRFHVGDLHWARPDGQTLYVEFRLPPGVYATTVLRELYTGTETGE